MKNKHTLNWKEIYIGVKKDFISPKEGLEKIDSNYLDKLDVNLIGELYSVEDNKKDFLTLLESFEIFREDGIKSGLNYWMKFYLEKVHSDHTSVT